MKIKKPTALRIAFTLSLIYIIFSYFKSMTYSNIKVDIAVIFSFVIIFILTIINIFRDSRPYSINKTYWYFNLIFFFLAPLAQYLSNYHVWGAVISDSTYLKGNCLIIFGNIIHVLFYKNNNEVYFDNEIKEQKKDKSLSLLIIALICFSLLIINVGVSNLFLRATNVSEFSENRMINTILTFFLKAVPVYCFSIAYNSKKRIDINIIIIGILVFLMNFPVSTTRFWMGSIYIGMVLMVFVKNRNNNRLQDLMFLMIFTVLFPLTYLFHFYSLEDILLNNRFSFDLASSYLAVDYDAYSIFLRIIDYAGQNGVVLGKQLIGTILFFIPRGIWAEKPLATGAFLARVTGQSFTNISSPFISEGYINFGITGIFVFEMGLSILSSKFDEKYWSKKKNKYLIIIYPYLIGLLLFYERGALHHAVVYTFCFMLPLIIIFIKNKIFTKKRSRYGQTEKAYNYY